jgi:hypothetical protein
MGTLGLPLGQRTIKKPGLLICADFARGSFTASRGSTAWFQALGYLLTELGPSARNIAGARLAAERIVEGALLKGRV